MLLLVAVVVVVMVVNCCHFCHCHCSGNHRNWTWLEEVKWRGCSPSPVKLLLLLLFLATSATPQIVAQCAQESRTFFNCVVCFFRQVMVVIAMLGGSNSSKFNHKLLGIKNELFA